MGVNMKAILKLILGVYEMELTGSMRSRVKYNKYSILFSKQAVSP
jgi:hypothetical protein